MRIKRRFLALFMAISLLCVISVTAYAHEVPDTSRRGSISITMTYDQRLVPGGELTLYRVGEIKEENGNYDFALTAEFAGSKASLEDIQSARLAKDLAAYATGCGIAGLTKEIGNNGEASFTNLELGLYLVVQNKAADGYSKADAFLVSIPMSENGTYIYTVDASPKVELEKAPVPTTPSKPSEPTLPQTGQLNWPIPILVMLGLCLFTVGWMLRFGKKRDGYAQ